MIEFKLKTTFFEVSSKLGSNPIEVVCSCRHFFLICPGGLELHSALFCARSGTF